MNDCHLCSRPELTTEEFKARIKAIVGLPEQIEGAKHSRNPSIRPEGQHGFYPAPPMNADPTRPSDQQ